MLMIKWGYTKKSNPKRMLKGFVLGATVLLFCIPNVALFVLIEPVYYFVQWKILLAIALSCFAIGLMEEAAIRGVVFPLLCEKWKDQKHVYWKAAVTSSVLFACLHLNWSVRYFISNGNLPLEYLLGNLYQVFYTFCFGMLAVGVTVYTRSILPMVFWHGICDFSARVMDGVLPQWALQHFSREEILSFQNVLNKYGILQGGSFGGKIVEVCICLLLVVIGACLIRKAQMNSKD